MSVNIDTVTMMKARYARASEETPVAIAAKTAGNLVNGYWLDDRYFFYLAEEYDAAAHRVISTPALADVVTDMAIPVMTRERLAQVLSEHSDLKVDSEVLTEAAYEMLDPGRLVVTLQKRAFHLDVDQERVVSVESLTETPELYSPDGHYAVFVKDYNIWLRDRKSGVSRALTTTGEKAFAYGQGFVRLPQAPIGVWSRNSEWFMTQRIDERRIPEAALVQHAPPGGGRPILHTYPYPMPDDPLPDRTYVGFHIPTGRTITIEPLPDWPLPSNPFAFKLAWFSDANDTFYFIRLSRYQTEVDLVALDLASGIPRVLFSEQASGYIDLNPLIGGRPNVAVLPRSQEIIWYSQRDGWGHLYLYDAGSGTLKNQITRGEWLVRDIVHVDERHRRIFFVAGGIDQTIEGGNRRLYAVDFTGENLREVVTHEEGDVSVPPWLPSGSGQERPFRPSYAPLGVSPSGGHVVIRRSSIHKGSRTSIVDIENKKELVIAAIPEGISGTAPRSFNALAADGQTRLYGAMFFPADFDENNTYPVIDFIYPGPQVPMLPRTYRSQSTGQARALAELGFVVVMLDSRGVPYRSRAFHQAGYGQLLEPQLSDHAAVMVQLCERYEWMDRERIGITGYSGGGFATARALFDYPDVFKVGVSICGNHDNRYYGAGWLEKYSGSHVKHTWEAQGNGSVAHKLKGKLFLISGDMDSNVNVSHTLKLADALIKANKDFDLLIVPNEEHALMLTSPYVQRRVWDYFVQHLMGAMPAKFELKYEPCDVAKLKEVLALEALFA